MYQVRVHTSITERTEYRICITTIMPLLTTSTTLMDILTSCECTPTRFHRRQQRLNPGPQRAAQLSRRATHITMPVTSDLITLIIIIITRLSTAA